MSTTNYTPPRLTTTFRDMVVEAVQRRIARQIAGDGREDIALREQLLPGLDLSGARVPFGLGFTRCDLRLANFSGGDFKRLVVNETPLCFADLRGSRFGWLCVQDGADLTGALLDNVTIERADMLLSPETLTARFRNVDLRGVRFYADVRSYGGGQQRTPVHGVRVGLDGCLCPVGEGRAFADLYNDSIPRDSVPFADLYEDMSARAEILRAAIVKMTAAYDEALAPASQPAPQSTLQPAGAVPDPLNLIDRLRLLNHRI